MPLVRAKVQADSTPINYTDKIAEKIQRRRYQILVHSLIYYELDTNLITDYQWTEWAKELVLLQEENPDISEKVIFFDAFKNFKGDTGMGLPYFDEQIVNIAYRLLLYKGDENSERVKYITTTPSEYDKYKLKSHSKENIVKKEVNKIEIQKPRKGLFRTPRA